MSQLPNAKGGKPSKRKAGAAAAQTQTNSIVTADDRVVRPRTDQSAAVGSKSGPAAAAGSSVPAVVSSLMRLAVVERQLIMQALDLKSLARLASTCSQLRAEALHREAGKFIPEPLAGSALSRACSIDWPHSAHASPLFRKHAPMRLNLVALFHAPATDSAAIDSLLDQAALVSRISTCHIGHSNIWTEPQLMRLLSLPGMQHVKMVTQIGSMCDNPRAQTALFSLPQLRDCEDMTVAPITTLLPSAIALASKLEFLSVDVQREPAASVRALRALRLAPALTSFDANFNHLDLTESVLAELVCCLAPTLAHFSLRNLHIPPDLPRSLVKALFSRTPLLRSVEISGIIETILRGLLDAGAGALPGLRRVHFRDVAPADFSVEDPDSIPTMLRRFLHRFPAVTVRLDIWGETWEDEDQLSAMLVRYLVWPRVELYWAESEERIARPPSPHASDDESGSGVEDWVDPHPLAAEAH